MLLNQTGILSYKIIDGSNKEPSIIGFFDKRSILLITINPFSVLSETIPSIVMQTFVIAMIVLVIVGTFFEMLHKKNVKYFFQNAKKAKQSATKTLGVGAKTSIVIKTVATDVLTTAELGAGQRRIAHVLGMWGTILFWATSAIMIFLLFNN